ncbi:MAG: ABC transporter substrate-binding protein [Pseudomonadota bacterium]|nr:ABC transporter substrate-binding protein [Pseudomonadota bacterium]
MTAKAKLRLFGAAMVGAAALGSGAVGAKTIKVGVPTFLTGAGAPAFGIPGKKGVQLIVRGINNGELPAPYNSKGFAGSQVQALIYDEAGGGTKQVTELRNKVQKDKVDAIIGMISSGTCAATTKVAEELKVLTILAVCGTPRIFEDINPNPKYVFRTMNHGTANNVSAAHYVARKLSSHVKNGFTGINQNYAWGQDSWRDFSLAMHHLVPSAKPSKKNQMPKIFAGQYGSEISALSRAKEGLVHSSFWGGDLESFIGQSSARGLFKRKMFVLTVGGTVAYRLGKKFPVGLIAGERGPYGLYVVNNPSPMNQWFQKEYRKAYGSPPSQPAYQYAQGFLAAKYAYDKAAKAAGKFPTTDQVIAALENANFPTFVGTVRMGLGKGHQGLTNDYWGVTVWDDKRNEMTVKDVVKFSYKCVMPPVGVKSVDWIKGGMKGAKC